ncbi:dsRBD fold-containing protein [Lentzea sp.]|uniref:dsRBD fold-containing protein n=1 Tax=Lentzea sp. TaxID=56099 RepID=UPI002ED33AB5
MSTAKKWTVDIHIDEHESSTRAEARLHTADDTHLVGVGLARLNPTDSDVPEIGDELAASRALADLAHLLLDAALNDLGATVAAQPGK